MTIPEPPPTSPRDERLVVFTRHPTPGRAKTRLIPAIGAVAAARVHRDLTEHTLRRLAPLARDATIEVRYEGASEEAFRRWLGSQPRLAPQGDGDLGDRMARAVADAFREGARRAVLIGVDAPDLAPSHVREAFARLRACDLVIGPAQDGGYYLIGLRAPVPEVFAGIEWGSSSVLEATAAAARRRDLHVETVETLADVDRPEDLPRLARMRRGDGRE